jgi:hypothetical protein
LVGGRVYLVAVEEEVGLGVVAAWAVVRVCFVEICHDVAGV